MFFRKTLFSYLSAILPIFFASAASAVIVSNPVCGSGNYDLLPNGSFETGDTTGWGAPFPGNGTWIASSEQACVGAFSAKSVPARNFVGAGYTLQRAVEGFVIGQEYVLSGFFNVAGVANAQVYLDIGDAPNDPNLFINSGLQGQSGWFFAHETFTAQALTLNIRLVMDGTVSTNDVAFIDEVAVTPVSQFQAAMSSTAVPEPGALGLMAIGLAGFGFATRRRR